MPKLSDVKKAATPVKKAKKTTSKGTWKQFERDVAAFFGTKRTPLSGGNSGITRSDTRSDHFFIEAKLRAKFQLYTLFKETKVLAKKENKIPIVTIREKGKQGFLILLSPDDIHEVSGILKQLENNTYNDQKNP